MGNFDIGKVIAEVDIYFFIKKLDRSTIEGMSGTHDNIWKLVDFLSVIEKLGVYTEWKR